MATHTVIVIGAGPAGLGAALSLRREGIDVTVLEALDEIGLHARGETIRFSPEMEALIYPGFFNKQARHRVNKRRYYSHTEKKHIDRTISTENLIIHWASFMNDIADIVRKAGAEIRTGVKVTALIEEHSVIKGVKIKKADAEEALYADTVFSCGGINDPGSLHIGLDRTKIDLPIHKRLVRNFEGHQDRLEYYFDVEPGGVPGVGCIFPRGNKEAEILLTPFTSLAKNDNPASQVKNFVDGFAERHQVFKKCIEGSETYYSLNTLVPMGGVLTSFAPRPGLVMAGDALGHVEARGGSGIRASFLLGYSSGKYSAPVIRSGEWTPEKMHSFEEQMKNDPQMKLLKKHALVYGTARRMIFKRLNTPEKMDSWWFVLKVLLA
jgi:flavin-dependent dehydrogenase